MSIEIRELQVEDYGKANDFYNRMHSSNHPLEEFNWEFLNGPCGKAIFSVAVDTENDDRVVGGHSVIPIEMVDNKGNIYFTAKSEGILIDPEFRKNFTFLKIEKLLFDKTNEQKIKYLWGFTHDEVHPKLMRFDMPFRSNQGMRVLSPFGAASYLSSLNPANKAISRLKILMLCLFSWVKGMAPLFRSREYAKYTFSEEKLVDKTNLFKSSVDPNDTFYFIHQDKKFLQWRLYDNPHPNDYKEFHLYKEGRLVADVIVNIRKKERIAFIEQILTSTELNEKIVLSFLDQCISEIKKPVPDKCA
jgi:hypothetical protein